MRGFSGREIGLSNSVGGLGPVIVFADSRYLVRPVGTGPFPLVIMNSSLSFDQQESWFHPPVELRDAAHWFAQRAPNFHSAVETCASSAARNCQLGDLPQSYSDGRESRFFYFDDVLARRLRPELFTSEDVLKHAKAFARAGRDKDGAQI